MGRSRKKSKKNKNYQKPQKVMLQIKISNLLRHLKVSFLTRTTFWNELSNKKFIQCFDRVWTFRTDYCLVLLQVPKYFGLVQIFGSYKTLIYILYHTKRISIQQICFLCRHTKEALNAITFLDWFKRFGPAQDILEPLEGQGIKYKTVKLKIIF